MRTVTMLSTICPKWQRSYFRADVRKTISSSDLLGAKHHWEPSRLERIFCKMSIEFSNGWWLWGPCSVGLIRWSCICYCAPVGYYEHFARRSLPLPHLYIVHALFIRASVGHNRFHSSRGLLVATIGTHINNALSSWTSQNLRISLPFKWRLAWLWYW